MILVLFTVIGTALFIIGAASLKSLKRLDSNDADTVIDPFDSVISILFSTAPRSAEFRKQQRITIWIFCSAILALFIARASTGL